MNKFWIILNCLSITALHCISAIQNYISNKLFVILEGKIQEYFDISLACITSAKK